MKHTPILDRSVNGGNQKVYKFDNSYGASVVNHSFSYGQELGVIRFEGDDFELCYTTPITSDVIGHLTDQEVDDILDRVKALPVPGSNEEKNARIEQKRAELDEEIKELERQLIGLRIKRSNLKTVETPLLGLNT